MKETKPGYHRILQAVPGQKDRLLKLLAVAVGAAGGLQLWDLFEAPQFAGMSMVAFYGVSLALLYQGLSPKNPRTEKQQAGYRLRVKILVVLLLIVMVITSALTLLRPSVHSDFKKEHFTVSSETGYEKLEEFTVLYADAYYLSLGIDNDYPVIFEVADSEGNVVFSNTAMKLEKDGMKMKLEKGTYELRISFASEEYQDSSVAITYGIQ